MKRDNGIMNALIQFARNASPYLAVELLLPGGSVIALLLWLYRHRFKKGAGPLGMPEIGPRGWIRSLASLFGLDRGLIKVWRPHADSFIRFRWASGALGTLGAGVAVVPSLSNCRIAHEPHPSAPISNR